MECRDRRIRIILSLLLTGMLTAGLLIETFQHTGTVINGFKQNATVVILLIPVFYLFFYYGTRWLFRRMDRFGEKEQEITGEKKRIAYLKDWGIVLGMIFLFWLPFLILFFPTVSLGYDYYWQLMQGTGVYPLSAHHPVFGSLVFGGLYRIGYLFGGATGGLFFTSLFQTLLMCGVLALCICCIKWLGLPRWIRGILLLFFALCPIFVTHGIWVIKDSIFSSLFTMFFLQVYMHVMATKGRIRFFWFSRLPWIVVTGLLSTFYRNGILPIVLVVFLGILWIGWRRREKDRLKKWALALAVLLCCSLLWSGIQKWMGVYPTNAREAFCMLSRQVVNTLRYYPDAVGGKDLATLEKAYRDNKSLKEVTKQYHAVKADPIKPSYFESTGDMMDYIWVWLRLGLHYPGTYLDAFLEGSDGYWYPLYSAQKVNHAIPLNPPEEDFANEERKNAKLNNAPLYAKNSLKDAGVDTKQIAVEYIRSKDEAVAEIFDVRSAFPDLRKELEKFYTWLEGVPVVSVFFTPGFYTWLLLIALAYICSRRKAAGYLWPILLLVALCMVSPVNGYMRYFLPVAMLAPLVMVLGLVKQPAPLQEEEREEEPKEDA